MLIFFRQFIEEHHTVQSHIKCLKSANPHFNYTVSAKITQ